MTRAAALALLVAGSTACRIERVSPHGTSTSETACDAQPQGELWVYTSMFRHVLDAFQPIVERHLPGVQVKYYQAGSEKIRNRLEAELTAGGTAADVLMSSDPFMFEHMKRDGRFLPYVSPHALRTPRELVDPDGMYTTCRVSTMVLVHREDLKDPPSSHLDLLAPGLRGKVALGDPLTSGTAATWAVTTEARYGLDFFKRLRDNRAVVAGGNAAVIQKVESGEAQVGVVVLENALTSRARGTSVRFRYPTDGAVIVPGSLAIMRTSKNPVAAKAFYDLVLSPEGQRAVVELGDLHSVDPRLPGPRGEPNVETLLRQAMPWTPELLERGCQRGDEIKQSFAEAFSQ